jgi:hypothetical protein
MGGTYDTHGDIPLNGLGLRKIKSGVKERNRLIWHTAEYNHLLLLTLYRNSGLQESR